MEGQQLDINSAIITDRREMGENSSINENISTQAKNGIDEEISNEYNNRTVNNPSQATTTLKETNVIETSAPHEQYTTVNNQSSKYSEPLTEQFHLEGSSLTENMIEFAKNCETGQDDPLMEEDRKENGKRKINNVWSDVLSNAETMKKPCLEQHIKKRKRQIQQRKILRNMVKDKISLFLTDILSPKKPLTVLHKMCRRFNIRVRPERLCNGEFVYTGEIQINGSAYSATGNTKNHAKQAVSEKVLKHLFLAKLKPNILEEKRTDKWLLRFNEIYTDSEDENEEVGANNPDNTVTNNDANNPDNAGTNSDANNPDNDGTNNDVNNPDNTVTNNDANNPDRNLSVNPKEDSQFLTISIRKKKDKEPDTFKFDKSNVWGLLASFALYKLFSEWFAEDYEDGCTKVVKEPKIPTVIAGKHPVSLLYEMNPNFHFTESRCCFGNTLVFKCSLTTADGTTYTASARSKKEAKKNCALKALEGLGVNCV